MSDIYSPGNERSSKNLLNRGSDRSVITDADVADDAAIAAGKLNAAVIQGMATAAGTVLVRHPLGAVPSFIAVTALSPALDAYISAYGPHTVAVSVAAAGSFLVRVEA